MPSVPPIPAQTTVGPVSLTVADLERSGRFYRDVLGLTPLRGELAPRAGGERPGRLPLRAGEGVDDE
jgi:catechol 2,3-dioxygenase-like lactoylglutathione lyase family enzyme